MHTHTYTHTHTQTHFQNGTKILSGNNLTKKKFWSVTHGEFLSSGEVNVQHDGKQSYGMKNLLYFGKNIAHDLSS